MEMSIEIETVTSASSTINQEIVAARPTHGAIPKAISAKLITSEVFFFAWADDDQAAHSAHALVATQSARPSHSCQRGSLPMQIATSTIASSSVPAWRNSGEVSEAESDMRIRRYPLLSWHSGSSGGVWDDVYFCRGVQAPGDAGAQLALQTALE